VVLLRQVIAAKTRRPPVDSATWIVRQPLNFFDEPLDSNRRARGTRGTRPLVPPGRPFKYRTPKRGERFAWRRYSARMVKRATGIVIVDYNCKVARLQGPDRAGKEAREPGKLGLGIATPPPPAPCPLSPRRDAESRDAGGGGDGRRLL